MYKATCDEFATVFEKVGELVGNTNLPRHGEQLVIEFQKLQQENEKLKKEQEENEFTIEMLKSRCSWVVMELDAERKISKKLAEERDALQEENEQCKKNLLEVIRCPGDTLAMRKPPWEKHP